MVRKGLARTAVGAAIGAAAVLAAVASRGRLGATTPISTKAITSTMAKCQPLPPAL